ncbi:MAG TPA: hypothetical protein PLE33_09020 [Candidatus Cloacimonas sp.]|nr:hypothetical protein [Candidatus Cloacimonas sp.]HPS61382.1 hypothetical protein [Candidatus Cloacimonas sp.]
MPYIYTITSDEKLLTQFYGFDKASKDAFEGGDIQRFEAIMVAQEFRKGLLDRLAELTGSEKPKLIDPKIINDKDNDPSLVERLSAFLIEKPKIKDFITQNQNMMSKKMSRFFSDIEQNTKDNEYVLFWLLSEEEKNEILQTN